MGLYYSNLPIEGTNMDILRTGIGIGRTIRNVSRLKEVLSVFAKNGFDEVIFKLKMTDVIPNFALPSVEESTLDLAERGEQFSGVLGHRLRLCFEELGPSFIKLGQVLATREDLFDPSFIFQMKKLHGNAKAMDFDQVKTIIEENLGAEIKTVFSAFNEEPIGTASIGGVYRATLQSGEEVVVKVRKPGLKKIVRGDFEILDWVIIQLEKVSEDIKTLGLRHMLAEFEKSLNRELNFFQEANNAKKVKEAMGRLPDAHFIRIPKIFDEYTGEDILVMDFLDGRAFNTLSHIDELGADGADKIKICVKSFVYSLLREGFFHADLHGGNFFLLTDGNIGLIDFGLMGSLSQKDRISLIVVLSSMLQEDFDRLVSEFLEIADYQSMPDEKKLVRDLRDALSPYLGLSVQQTDVPALFRGIFHVLTDHKIMLPTEWFLIFRSIVMLDGIGQSLKIDLNFHELIMEDMEELASGILNLSELKKEALWLTRDGIASLRVLPRHVRWFAKHLEKRDYVLEFEVKGVESGFERLARSVEFLALIFFAAVCFCFAVFFVKDTLIFNLSDISILSWLSMLFGLLTLLFAVKRLSKKD